MGHLEKGKGRSDTKDGMRRRSYVPTRRFQKKKKTIVDCSENLVPSGGILKIVPQNPNLKQSIYVYQTQSLPSYPKGTQERPSGVMPNRALTILGLDLLG